MSQNHSKVAEKAPLEKRVGRVDERIIMQPALKQHAQYKQITEIIIEITKITENAVKIRRNTKDFVEVEAEELERVIVRLRRVTEAQQQPTGDNALQRILENTEEIRKKIATPQPQGARS